VPRSCKAYLFEIVVGHDSVLLEGFSKGVVLQLSQWRLKPCEWTNFGFGAAVQTRRQKRSDWMLDGRFAA